MGSFDSRAVVPSASDAKPFEVRDGFVIPVGTSGFLGLGVDADGLARTVRVGALGVTAIPVGYQNSLPMGRFLVTPPLLAEGEFQHLLFDANGNLKTISTVIPIAVGTHGNAWNATITGVNGISNSVDCQFTDSISVFGNVDAATVITMQLSQNNINFYDAVIVNVVGGGDFEMSRVVGARYVRLKSSGSVTATVTIAGKA